MYSDFWFFSFRKKELEIVTKAILTSAVFHPLFIAQTPSCISNTPMERQLVPYVSYSAFIWSLSKLTILIHIWNNF